MSQVTTDLSNHVSIDPHDVKSALRSVPVMCILRDLEPKAALDAIESAWSLGVRVVEFPLDSERAHHSLASALREWRSTPLIIGAGTITDARRLDAATRLSAMFCVSPGIDEQVISAAYAAEMPFLPGVCTPSDVQMGLNLGLVTFKLFPAGPLGSAWLRALRTPFPAVDFLAVGQVSVDNAAAFIRSGAIGVGLGSRLSELPNVISSLAPLSQEEDADEMSSDDR